MLVNMNRLEFGALDDASLVWTCIEPTIRQIRGKSFMVKSEFSARLNTGQRSLLMFQMLYGHSGNGSLELFCHLSYLLSQKGVWSHLKNGMQYFGVRDSIQLLDELEDLYGILVKKSGELNSFYLDLNSAEIDPELQETICRLDGQIFEMNQSALKLVGTYVRNHPDEFVHIED